MSSAWLMDGDMYTHLKLFFSFFLSLTVIRSLWEARDRAIRYKHACGSGNLCTQKRKRTRLSIINNRSDGQVLLTNSVITEYCPLVLTRDVENPIRSRSFFFLSRKALRKAPHGVSITKRPVIMRANTASSKCPNPSNIWHCVRGAVKTVINGFLSIQKLSTAQLFEHVLLRKDRS